LNIKTYVGYKTRMSKLFDFGLKLFASVKSKNVLYKDL
jgi:hypothetical protein